MQIKNARQFIAAIQQFNIDTDYVVVKPNWVSNSKGEYTEPQILDWLFAALPSQKKIVTESYTPWRGKKFSTNNKTLQAGQEKWDLYKQQDREFLQQTGIDQVLAKHHVKYINVTNEFWSERCVPAATIQSLLATTSKPITFSELTAYIPQKLFDIRTEATFISLSKIKTESNIPHIRASMSVKNLFGMIPNPSRHSRYHGTHHELVPIAIRDIYTIYTTLFPTSLWIAEGIQTWVENYCTQNQQIKFDQRLCFIGRSGIDTDCEACHAVDIDPISVNHLQK